MFLPLLNVAFSPSPVTVAFTILVTVATVPVYPTVSIISGILLNTFAFFKSVCNISSFFLAFISKGSLVIVLAKSSQTFLPYLTNTLEILYCLLFLCLAILLFLSIYLSIFLCMCNNLLIHHIPFFQIIINTLHYFNLL